MMKSVVATLVFALYALILPLCFGVNNAVAGSTVTYPHSDPGTGVTCRTCHTANQVLGSTGYNNVCLTCHNPSSGVPGSDKSFIGDDAANPLNNHAASKYQTSHRWDGSDTVPAAGALPPLNPAMNADNLGARAGNQMACVRCHDPHRNNKGCAVCHDPSYDPKSAPKVATNFLRIDNDKDQMCLDCHRTRDVTSHQKGSHPVQVNYSSVAAAKPTLFNKKPINAGLSFNNNTTSDLNARLVASGKQVLCSTCHGTHFTDSRSSTRDGAAFDNNTGDGYILHTDRRGKAVAANQSDNLNICTNCHASKKNHNNGGQDIQCNDCHGAHVEYDPADPTGAQGINAYLIRRYINYTSTAKQPKKMFYRYTAASKKEFVKTDGLGMCQGCHVAPTAAIHTDIKSADCLQCHSHSNPKGSFKAKCDDCHGYPPATINSGANSHQTSNNDCSQCHGKYDSVKHSTPDAKTCTGCHPVLGGSHAKHIGDILSSGLVNSFSATGFSANNSDSSGYRFGCAYCHPAVNASHMSLGLKNAELIVGIGANIVTKNVNITCATSICHADGKGNFTVSPNWYSGFTGTDKCAMCHAATPTSGSHVAHTTNGIHDGSGTISYAASLSCVKCHASTVDGSKNITYTNHVNGVVNVAFVNASEVSKAQISAASFNQYSTVWTRTGATDTSKLALGAGGYAGGTCSTIACHNNGTTPAWGTTAKISCVACHSAL